MRDAMLFVHFLGLILGLGAGFASFVINATNKDLGNEERPQFMLRMRALGYMGLAGLVLLIISGGYLATPYWPVIDTMPFFIAKLSLVVVLLVLVLMMDWRWRKAVKDRGGVHLHALPKLGRLAFPIGILILLFAVLQFH